MKKTFFLLIIFYFSSTANAQLDRSISPSQHNTSSSNETKFDFVEESVKSLKKKVGLDDLQATMVKVYLEESFEKIKGIIDSTDLNYVEKEAKIEEYKTKLEFNIKEILSSEQKVKYEKLSSKKK